MDDNWRKRPNVNLSLYSISTWTWALLSQLVFPQVRPYSVSRESDKKVENL
jgi:hypothetical protein